MADQLDLGRLSLADSQHANGGMGRSTYIPPHMRGVPAADPAPPPAVNGNMGNGAWNGARSVANFTEPIGVLY